MMPKDLDDYEREDAESAAKQIKRINAHKNREVALINMDTGESLDMPLVSVSPIGVFQQAHIKPKYDRKKKQLIEQKPWIVWTSFTGLRVCFPPSDEFCRDVCQRCERSERVQEKARKKRKGKKKADKKKGE